MFGASYVTGLKKNVTFVIWARFFPSQLKNIYIIHSLLNMFGQDSKLTGQKGKCSSKALVQNDNMQVPDYLG